MENHILDLQLGDIIKIYSPRNDDYHEKVFYINYLDSLQLHIVNDKEKHILNINDKSMLSDKSITEIDLLYRNKDKGFVKQNDFKEGDWLNIYFLGNEPFILICEITQIIEDAIEIKRYQTGEILYIDFGYNGIPLNLNIEKIEKRYNSPEEGTKENDKLEEKRQESDDVDDIDDLEIVKEKKEKEEDKEKDEEKQEEDNENEEVIKDLNSEKYAKEGEFLVENDENMYPEEEEDIEDTIKKSSGLIILEDLESLTEMVNVSEEEQRYGISIQMNDLLNTILIDEPKYKESRKMEEVANKYVQRFQELREKKSDLDDNNNYIKPKLKGANYKPIVENMKTFNHKLLWLIPTTYANRKLYNVSEDEIQDRYDIVVVSDEEFMDEVLFFKDFKKNAAQMEENRYEYYNTKIDELYLSHENVNNDEYYKVKVGENVLGLLNNLGNYTSSVINKGVLTSVNKYNYTYLKNEEMEFDSLTIMPYEIMNYSKIYMHNTSILDKVKYNNVNVLLKDILNENISQELLNLNEETEEEEIINKEISWKDSTNYIFEYDVEKNNHENYELYFDKLIPKTKTLFNKYKNKFDSCYSLNDVLRHMEIFLSDIDNVSYKQYQNYIYHVKSHKDKYLTDINENNKLYDKVMSVHNKRTRKNTMTTGNPIELKIDEILNQVLNNNKIISGDEFNNYTFNEKILLLKKIDNNNFLNILIDNTNFELFSLISLNNALNYFNEKFNVLEESENECNKKIVIAKKYWTDDDIVNDCKQKIYFDKEYDNTVYDILDVYNDERKKRDPENFKEYLREKLKEINNLSDEDSIYYVETLLQKKKEVKNGHYAILQDLGENEEVIFKYYIRTDDDWIFDKKVTDENKENFTLVNNDDTCNLKEECISTNIKYNNSLDSSKGSEGKLYHSKIASNEEDCESSANELVKYNRELLDRMTMEFKHSINMEKEQLEKYIEKKKNILVVKFEKKKQLLDLNINKYEIFKRQCGALFNPLMDLIISPYYDIMQKVLNIKDFVTKQMYIIEFCKHYTKSPTETQDQNWYYCIDTNSKLIPTFILELAIAFQNGNYSEVLEKVCKDRGKISDDQESIVDKHSGLRIRMRLLMGDMDDGDIAFKSTKEEMGVEENNENEDEENEENDEKILNEGLDYTNEEISSISESMYNDDLMYINNMVNTINTFLNIIMSKKQQNDIVYLVSKIYDTYFYNKKEELQVKYVRYNYLFFGIYLIVVQVESIIIKKRFSGCVGNFLGYPLDEHGKDDGMKYLSCVILHLSKKKKNIFEVFKKTNDITLSEKIKDTLVKYILNDPYIIQILEEKRNNLLKVKKEILNWNDFKPFLYENSVKIIKNFDAHFFKKMKEEFYGKNDNGIIYLNKIKSKVKELNAMFHNILNKVVGKEILLLKNTFEEPFVENVCCMTSENNVLNYFNNQDSSLMKYVEMIESNENVFKMLKNHLISKTLGTRIINSHLPKIEFIDYDEETIYLTFLEYCKWDKEKNTFTLKHDMESVCEIGEEIEITDNMTLNDKIQMLKEAGKNLNKNMLMVLMKNVFKLNELDIDGEYDKINKLELYNKLLLDEIKLDEVSQVNKDIIEMLNTFDISMPSSNIYKENLKLQTMLDKNIKQKTNNIVEFLKSYSRTSDKNTISKIKTFLNIDQYKETSNIVNTSKFYKYMSYLINNVFRNIVINKVNYENIDKEYIPKHWELDETHIKDITKILDNYYNVFNKFYNETHLTEYLISLTDISNKLDLYTRSIPIYMDMIDNNKITSLLNSETLVHIYHYIMVTNIHLYIEEINDSINETDKVSLKKSISEYIKMILMYGSNFTNNLVMTKEEILKKVLLAKEKEKMKIVDDFENMSESHREIENELKKYKLGKWSKGLSKGLINYDKNVYASERQEMGNVDLYVVSDENEISNISHLDDDENMESFDEY